jgi:hypothetical protein
MAETLNVGDFVRYLGSDGRYHYRVIDKVQTTIAAVIDSWYLGPWYTIPGRGGQFAEMAPIHHWAPFSDFELRDPDVFHEEEPPA